MISEGGYAVWAMKGSGEKVPPEYRYWSALINEARDDD
jgi:hypothetical protein